MAAATTRNSDNVELGHVRDGYPALAAWIGGDPDGETLVFRRFRRLGARNLLHLQSQLIQLEKEIDELDLQARTSADLNSRQASRRWETFIELAADSGRPEKARMEKVEELSVKIKEYEEALLRQFQIANLGGPSTRVLSAYRCYLEGGFEKGPADPSVRLISGKAKDMLDEPDDLVSLKRRTDEDFLTKSLQDHWAFQSRRTKDPLDCTTVYRENHVKRVVSIISILSAASLLVVAIVSLYVVKNPATKLGLVVVYTFIFALSVALLTSARRAEVYSAAAAYAAVLVVFVSGGLSAG